MRTTGRLCGLARGHPTSTAAIRARVYPRGQAVAFALPLSCRRSSTIPPKDGSESSSNLLRNGIILSAALATTWALYAGSQGKLRLDSISSLKHFFGGPDPTLTPTHHETAQLHTHSSHNAGDLPVEKAILTHAPEVPPPITRTHPVLLQAPLESTTKLTQLTSTHKYDQWTFNDDVPGPFIRARVGDTLELSLHNRDESGHPHNIDCHAVLGPGGGAALTTAGEGQTKTARFKLTCPGLYVYHCAAAPVPVHIAMGMYGLIYVQPETDLPPVDKEYYVMQSEFYTEPPEKLPGGKTSDTLHFSYPAALREEPSNVFFNGNESALTRDKPLKARVDETVRIFFGNAGPNLTSSFHVIGSNFEKLYRDGDVLSPPGQFVQTTSVPPGGATVVDMKMVVPGTYTLVDHAIFRLDKGAVGYLNVAGEARPDMYHSSEPAEPCVGCKLHP